MAFIVKKKFDLKYQGEGWEEAYIVFTPFTFDDNDALLKLRGVIKTTDPKKVNLDDAKPASNIIIKLLQERLIEGKGWDGEKLIDITKENLGQLPMEVITDCLSWLQGKKTE